ncbi:hypothetical protein BGX38DRAFT_645262 [Terfezia claveryi]|nr:hypothetical protein BGX38DRAFT_645262 [Terfezia claveryi]
MHLSALLVPQKGLLILPCFLHIGGSAKFRHCSCYPGTFCYTTSTFMYQLTSVRSTSLRANGTPPQPLRLQNHLTWLRSQLSCHIRRSKQLLVIVTRSLDCFASYIKSELVNFVGGLKIL